MKRLREDVIHYAVRQFLSKSSWELIAGQYPNGSDDELPPLNIMDPELAKDNSPDHRRHSMNKVVPDLVAIKGMQILLIEMKPAYSASDAAKLSELISIRKEDLIASLLELQNIRKASFPYPIRDFTFVPALGFSVLPKRALDEKFCYFLVSSATNVRFIGNALVNEIS